MYDENETTGIKAIAAVGTVCLVVTMVTLHRVPAAAGYEISIYRAYPWYFWGCLIGAAFLGQVVMLLSATADRGEGNDWIVGGVLTVVPGLVLMLLPYIRGYPIYGRADVLTHVGLIHDLTETGISENIYTPMHILVQSLAVATGLEMMQIMTLLPVVFGLVFFGSLSLVVVQLFERRQRVLLSLPVVLIPVAGPSHVTVVPFVVSVLLTPLMLYLVIKELRTHAVPFRAMLIVTIVGVVVYHPLTAFFLLVVLGLYSAFHHLPALRSQWTGLPNLASLSIVVFSAWYMQYAGIIIRFRNIISDFLGSESGESPLDATTETVERTSPESFDLLRMAILQRGDDVLIFGLATVFLVFVGLLWYRSGDRPEATVVLFGCTMLLFGVIATVFLTNDLIVGYGRPLLFGKLFAVPFVGAAFHLFRQGAVTPTGKTVVSATFAVVLLVLLSLMVFSMFTSPLGFDRNDQVTHSEIDGTEWLYEHRNEDLLIDERGIRQHRFYHMHYGTQDPSPTIRQGGASPPDHFNYTEHDTLGMSYDDSRYLLLTELARITYPERFPDYPDQWRFTADDFERVENDRSVARVYDNGEFNAYHVQGSREQ